MPFRARLLLFGYPALELLTMYALAQWLGWAWALIIFLAGIPIGIVIMRWAALRGNALGFIGGVLWAIPGVWSDLAGLVLIFPPTQAIFRGKAEAWAQARVVTMRFPGAEFRPSDGPRRDGNSGGDVIEGEIL